MNGEKDPLGWATQNDPTVCANLRAGLPLEELVARLVVEKQELTKQLAKLSEIAPRGFRLPDGSVRIWHCPDELIPIETISPAQPAPDQVQCHPTPKGRQRVDIDSKTMRCTCSVATLCPLGKAGSEARCTVSEVLAAGLGAAFVTVKEDKKA